MSSRYPILAGQTSVETLVVNSRFVCNIAVATSVDEALQFIRAVKTAHAAASSHAYAYHVGYGASVTDGCNDGGEPSGTAGRPMLAVLQGSGLGDVVAVVSRYFGGTKLGTGGLVRAFSGALKAALDAAPRTERIERAQYCVTVGYALYERLTRLLSGFDCVVVGSAFEAEVRLDLLLAVEEAERCAKAIGDLTGGQARLIRSAKRT